jgi:hypothetical protein
MKTSRYILIAAVSLLIGLSNAALADTSVYIGFGIGGHPGFHRGHCHDYRFCHRPRYFGPSRWHCRSHRQTIILSGGYWYDWGPDYYIVTQPTVIEKVPVVVEKQTVVVQPVEFDERTLELNKKLQNKKNELLRTLETEDKDQRKEAIKELAGFSFDDKVRGALEDVLLSDPNVELRQEAAQSFGKVKNTKALAALEKARVEDSSEDVRKAADEAIKKIKGN